MAIITHQFIPNSLGKQEKNIQFFVGKDSYYIRTKGKHHRVFKGVTDAEASYSTGPEEWSAKEVLVHLIHNERDLHSWINDLVADQERFYDQWPGDRLFRIKATLTTYPGVDDLITEFRRSLKETVASIAFLKPNFTRRKASYTRLAIALLDTPKHVDEHIQQIKDNIKAARTATTN